MNETLQQKFSTWVFFTRATKKNLFLSIESWLFNDGILISWFSFTNPQTGHRISSLTYNPQPSSTVCQGPFFKIQVDVSQN